MTYLPIGPVKIVFPGTGGAGTWSVNRDALAAWLVEHATLQSMDLRGPDLPYDRLYMGYVPQLTYHHPLRAVANKARDQFCLMPSDDYRPQPRLPWLRPCDDCGEAHE